MTTPNACRLENVFLMTLGYNIYDQYSGYGPYGRHNREYTRHDLSMLLELAGFEIEVAYTADVNENHVLDNERLDRLLDSFQDVKFREYDLGQYIFVRARLKKKVDLHIKRPDWLYRSWLSD